MRRVLWLGPLVAGVVAVGVIAGSDGAPKEVGLPTTQRVLLRAPVPGAAARGVFVRDPAGQVDRLAAEGHLVAWTVRTPPDSLGNRDSDAPINLPRTTSVVVADERGGRPVVVEYPTRWISALRFVHPAAAGGPPVLDVHGCRTRSDSSCGHEALTFGPGRRLQLTSRAHGPAVDDAALPTADRGRELVAAAAPKGTCIPPLRLRSVTGGSSRALPAITLQHDSWYPDCEFSTPELLHGRYAFVSVRSSGTVSGLEVETWFGLDVDGGSSARWHGVQSPYRYSDGSTGYEIGPAVTDGALYWEELDGDGSGAYSVERVRLPADLRDGYDPRAPTESDPIRLGGQDTCAVAATADALYELDNARCAPFDNSGDRGGGVYRVANPLFWPPPN